MNKFSSLFLLECLLFDICRGICSTDAQVKLAIQTLISPLAEGYAELYREQKKFPTLQKCGKEEFFGLRDFYRWAVPAGTSLNKSRYYCSLVIGLIYYLFCFSYYVVVLSKWCMQLLPNPGKGQCGVNLNTLLGGTLVVWWKASQWKYSNDTFWSQM